MTQTAAFATLRAGSPLEPHTIERRALRAKDVAIRIAYCGVCHSDVHKVRQEWGETRFPLVPGHEIVGHVTAVGSEARKFKVGDTVGVGVMVDSCRTCDSCREGQEQYCETGFVGTYGGSDRSDGSSTHGGYSTDIVTDERFVLRIGANLELSRVAPLLCAGITTYSPLRHFGVGDGSKVGIIGIGGLGHVAVKLARALGAQVTVITRSAHKQQEATRLGAHATLLSTDAAQMAASKATFDVLLCTVSGKYVMADYLALLKREGTFVALGMPDKPIEAPLKAIVNRRLSVAGSLIGGVAETQEMLDFCATHNILCDVEVIPMDAINTAYDRMVTSDVKYRFVIDMQSLKGVPLQA